MRLEPRVTLISSQGEQYEDAAELSSPPHQLDFITAQSALKTLF